MGCLTINIAFDTSVPSHKVCHLIFIRLQGCIGYEFPPGEGFLGKL